MSKVKLKVSGEFNITATPEPLKMVKEKELVTLMGAYSDSTYNKETKTWDNGEPLWVKINIWGKRAEQAKDYNKSDKIVLVNAPMKITKWKEKVYYQLDVDFGVDYVHLPYVKKDQSNSQPASDPPSTTMPNDPDCPF